MADESKAFEGDVLVLGATGNIGQATVKFLSGKVRSIKAGSRNPDSDKAQALAALEGVTAVKASDAATVEAESKGVDAVFIVTPGCEDRAAVAISYAKAAAAAGVTKLVVISVPFKASDMHLFARQFRELEAGVREVSSDAVFLGLPFFTDNQWGNAGTIKSMGKIFAPVKPDAAFVSIAAQDVPPAFFSVLTKFDAYKGKKFVLTSDAQSYGSIAKAFGEALEKEVTYVQVPNEAAKKAMMDMGFPEWQVDGIIELFDLINASDETLTNVTSDLETLTGKSGTSTAAWIASVKAGFQ